MTEKTFSADHAAPTPAADITPPPSLSVSGSVSLSQPETAPTSPPLEEDEANSEFGISNSELEHDPAEDLESNSPYHGITGYKSAVFGPSPPRVQYQPPIYVDRSLMPPKQPTRPNGRPFAPARVQDTYDLPHLYTCEQFNELVEQHHADHDADFTGRPNDAPYDNSIYNQISPEIGTPEYLARPARIQRALHRSNQLMPELIPLNTLEEFETHAAHIARYIRAYPELALLVGDFAELCFQRDDPFEKYVNPYRRAANYVSPEPVDEDPAPLNLYLQRARKKTLTSLNRMLDREAQGHEVNTDRIRNLLAYATIAKYAKQSSPLDRSPGRPLEPNGKTIQRAHTSPSNWGGKREGAGGKFKRKILDEDDANSSETNRSHED